MLTTAPTEPTKGVPQWLKIFSASLVVLLIASALFRLFTPDQIPPQTLVTQNVDGTQSNFSNITFVGEEPSVPSSLPIGSAESSQLSGDEIEQQLVSSFELTANPEDPTIWTSQDYSLNSRNNKTVFSLTRTRSVVGESNQAFSAKTAISAATSLLDKAVPNHTWQPIPQGIKYFTGGLQVIETDSKNANLIEVPFGNKFGNYLVFSEQQLNLPAKVMLDSSYNLVKLEIRTIQLATTQQQKINTIPIGQALKQIEEGNASIINYLFLGFGQESIGEIASAKFDTVTIEYRVDNETNQAVPYYRFSGEITNDQDQTMVADVITPAIQTKF